MNRDTVLNLVCLATLLASSSVLRAPRSPKTVAHRLDAGVAGPVCAGVGSMANNLGMRPEAAVPTTRSDR